MSTPGNIEYPVKIVSDLHYRIIGGKLKSKNAVRPIFEGFRTIILNGDSVEQHLYGLIRAECHKAELIQVARDVGATLVFLRGNHDPSIGPSEYEIKNRDRTIRIMHGDFGLIQLNVADYGAHRRPLSFLWYTLRTFRSYPVYWRQIEMAKNRMQDNEVYVLGHTHQPSLSVIGSKSVVNLGAHMRGFADAWIEIPIEHGPVRLAGKLHGEV